MIRVVHERCLGKSWAGSDDSLRLLAALKLGHIYEHGFGVTVDYTKAYEYYEKAGSEEKLTGAVGLLHLGIMYDGGKGVDKDWSKAKEFCRRSAKLGNLFARKNLGLLMMQTGNVPYGLWLWVSTVVELALIGIFKKSSLRFRYGFAGNL